MSRQILIIDNDVMVALFWNLYHHDKNLFKKVMSDLLFKYGSIWVPQKIRFEFLLKRNDKQREKVLEKIQQMYQSVIDCPIRVGELEIKGIINNKVHEGEADAILQASKAKSKTDKGFKFKDIILFSNDVGALKVAETKYNITIKNYNEYKSQLRERGFIIP